MTCMAIYLAAEKKADALLTKDPLALLIGMLLDQQIPMEHAFSSPYHLKERLGTALDAALIASYDPVKLEAIFKGPPALHRFPGSMAKRTQAMCQQLVDDYDGDCTKIWADGDGATVLKRLKALPGFGEEKSRIFLALLGKQYGAGPAGWEKAAGAYGESGVFRSVADIVDDASLAKVRAYKKEKKAAAKAKK